MNQQQEHLLQKALFDELDPREARELEELLERSPEAARKLSGMRRILGQTREAAANARKDEQQQAAASALAAHICSSLPERAAAHTSRLARVKRELTLRCPYYFILAGLLHLLLGAALQGMLRAPLAASQAPVWVLWQPEFALLTGAFFLLCGGLLLTRSSLGSRVSYWGLVVYIAFVAANGLTLQLQLGVPRVLPGLLAFAGMGLTIGALLGVLLQHYNKDLGNGKTLHG